MSIQKSLFITVISSILMASCGTVEKSDQIKITAHQPILPVLAKRELNKTLEITLEVEDSSVVHKAVSFTFALEGTSDIADVQSASLFYATTDDFGKANIVGTTPDLRSIFSITTDRELSAGENHFWLSTTLKGTPDLSHKIGAQLVSVEMGDGSKVEPLDQASDRPQRIGIALRQKDDDQVNTYRIPGLATTNEGTLLALYDVRYNDPVDLQEDIDVGLSRSTDGGQTWEPMKIIMDMGEYGGLPEDENGIGDPAVLVDRNTNTIWVAALWLHGFPGERAWNASEPGMSPKETGQFMLVKSEDDGNTWSDPINITDQIKNPEWQLFFNGPGMGISLKDGTLVFAAQFKDKDRIPHSTIIYSKDGGENWQVGTGAKSETTEAQVVELSDGSLMLNMRDDRNRADRNDSINGRSVAITKDLGKTWTEHPQKKHASETTRK